MTEVTVTEKTKGEMTGMTGIDHEMMTWREVKARDTTAQEDREILSVAEITVVAESGTSLSLRIEGEVGLTVAKDTDIRQSQVNT